MVDKTYVQGRVSKDVYDEFVQNAFLQYGPVQGFKGKALEEALRCFNNYFKDYGGYSFRTVLKNRNVDPHELGEYMIRRIILWEKLMEDEGIQIENEDIIEVLAEAINLVRIKKTKKDTGIVNPALFLYGFPLFPIILSFEECGFIMERVALLMPLLL